MQRKFKSNTIENLMEQTKKQKYIRIVGLITLTILVVVGVVLAIYFTQKNDTVIAGQIGQKIEQDKYTFEVTSFKTNKETLDNGYVQCTTYITIEAKKDMKISLKDFSLNGNELKEAVGFKEKLKKGENLSFELNWVVKEDKELLYLIYKNLKIALGEVQI